MVDIFFLRSFWNFIVVYGHLAKWFNARSLVLNNLALGPFILLVLVAKRKAEADCFRHFLLYNSIYNNFLRHFVARREWFKQSSLELVASLVASCWVYIPGTTWVKLGLFIYSWKNDFVQFLLWWLVTAAWILEINSALNTAAWLHWLNLSLGGPFEITDFSFKWFKRHVQVSCYVVIEVLIFRRRAYVADFTFKLWAISVLWVFLRIDVLYWLSEIISFLSLNNFWR